MSESSQQPYEEQRAYLLDMIRQLARLAQSSGEVEVEILLRATLDVTQAKDRSTLRNASLPAKSAT